MRILHTADLHLGRLFNKYSLEDDHATILSQIVDAVVARRAEVLILAGDIFDRTIPPASAVRQLNDFLRRIDSETDAAVVMIAGNHDSGDRIEAMSIMANASRTLIRGVVSADEKPLILSDEHGDVAFSGLPFSYEYAARECFGNETIHTPQDVLTAQVAAARGNLATNTRWVIVAHAFVSDKKTVLGANVPGAETSASERPLARVGGIETVNPDTFKGAHYVALGHLHRAQSAGGAHIRYPGSPLAFGFDEAKKDAKKSMNFVEIDGAGKATVEEIPLIPLRGVREIRGKHAELLLNTFSTDFIRAVLTDDADIIDGMKRLWDVFPNACELVYERKEEASENISHDDTGRQAATPIELINGFLNSVRNEQMSEKDRDIVERALQTIRDREDAQ